MKICVIIPYFGSLPLNINTFLYSTFYNKKIDWLILTDQRINIKYGKNVKFIYSTFEEVKERLQKVVGAKINLSTPYKLCDYRPLYGKAFADYLRDYDYWGYGDLDVVYGNLMKFISSGLKNNYDRIGGLGHFTLYRNNPDVNNRYLLTCKDRHGRTIRPFDRVYRHSRGYAFDELGINYIYRDHHFGTYKNDDLVNETKTGCLDLYSIDPRFRNFEGTFVWSNGKCLYYYLDPQTDKLHSHEYGYFHLQKRHEFTKFLSKNVNSFIITTNGYYRLERLDNTVIKTMIKENHSIYSKRLLYWLHSYFLSGDITFREILGIHLPIFEIYRELKNHTLRI